MSEHPRRRALNMVAVPGHRADRDLHSGKQDADTEHDGDRVGLDVGELPDRPKRHRVHLVGSSISHTTPARKKKKIKKALPKRRRRFPTTTEVSTGTQETARSGHSPPTQATLPPRAAESLPAFFPDPVAATSYLREQLVSTVRSLLCGAGCCLLLTLPLAGGHTLSYTQHPF